MPGFHAIKIGSSVNSSKKDKESLYGFLKSKKGKARDHPLFEELKKSQVRDKGEFLRILKERQILRDPNGFDSLKLLGDNNDSNYLDSFMSVPRNRRVSVGEFPDSRSSKSISKSPSAAALTKGSQGSNKGSNLHSASDPNLTLAMINSLRNSGSEDNIYESVEMIHYRKTMGLLNHQKKTRALQKTGHPLFDHLREQQALREDSPKKRPGRRQYEAPANHYSGYRTLEYITSSNGNSPSPSSSSSGDEYDLYAGVHSSKSSKALQEAPRHFSSRPLPKEPTKGSRPLSSQDVKRQENIKPQKIKSCKSEQVLHESDDDWIIPRPRLFKLTGLSRRRIAEAPSSTTSDESDSSSKSAGLR